MGSGLRVRNPLEQYIYITGNITQCELDVDVGVCLQQGRTKKDINYGNHYRKNGGSGTERLGIA